MHSLGWEDCRLPFHVGSHMPSSEDLASFLEGGHCSAKSELWLKIVPTKQTNVKQHFNVALVLLLVSVCCDTAQALAFLLVSVCCDTAQALAFLLVSVCCDTAQALVFLLVSVCCDSSPSLLVSVCCNIGVLAGVSALWHSPNLDVLAGVSGCDTAQSLVFLLVSVCCDTAQALVFLLVSVCCELGLVFLLVSLCCDTAQALAFWLVSMCFDSPSIGVFAGVSELWHSPNLGVLAGVNVLWCSPSLGVLAGVSTLWHSPSLDVLAGVIVLWHSPNLGVFAGVSALIPSFDYSLWLYSDCFCMCTYTMLPGSGGTDHPAGEHSYPFCLLLGASLPSSFEGRRGYVRYFCKASINRPWKFDEHTKRAFTVIHPLDLNMVPTAGVSWCGLLNWSSPSVHRSQCMQFLTISPPREAGGIWCLPPCLKSQDCHLNLLSYLLSCFFLPSPLGGFFLPFFC